MNLRDGNPEEARRAMIEAQRQLDETRANWDYIHRLESESLGHLSDNNFAARMKRAFQGDLTP